MIFQTILFADFFFKISKNILVIDLPSEFQTGLIQLKHDIDMSCLIWVKCLQRLSADDTLSLRGKEFKENMMVRNSKNRILTLYLIETPLNAFANIADPDQAALVRAG